MDVTSNMGRSLHEKQPAGFGCRPNMAEAAGGTSYTIKTPPPPCCLNMTTRRLAGPCFVTSKALFTADIQRHMYEQSFSFLSNCSTIPLNKLLPQEAIEYLQGESLKLSSSGLKRLLERVQSNSKIITVKTPGFGYLTCSTRMGR
jgi:hypothetical protein